MWVCITQAEIEIFHRTCKSYMNMQNPRGHYCILLWQNWTSVWEELAVDRSEFFRNVCTLLPTTHYHCPKTAIFVVTVVRTWHLTDLRHVWHLLGTQFCDCQQCEPHLSRTLPHILTLQNWVPHITLSFKLLLEMLNENFILSWLTGNTHVIQCGRRHVLYFRTWNLYVS